MDRLVRRGVVVREPDDGDHRGRIVQLTGEGLRLFDEAAPVPGLLVAGTLAGAPAAEAGLTRGDLIVAANGSEVRCAEALAEALAEAIDAAPRGRLRFDVLRGDTPVRITVRRDADRR